jgi:hypothetical protein
MSDGNSGYEFGGREDEFACLELKGRVLVPAVRVEQQ